MKSIFLLLIGALAAVLIIGCSFAFIVLQDVGNGGSSDVVEKISSVANSGDSSDGSGQSSGIVEVVKDEIVSSGQSGGSYRQVSYDDGGFRQYDVDTGELIGSSYDSDQSKLPNLE